MSYVFVSYSHQDTEYAHRLADELQKQLIDAWIDDRIDYGSTWPHVIQEQIDNCSAFIVIMSPRSYVSEWVQNEVARAKRKQKYVFPVLLDGDLWVSFEAKQHIDVTNGELPPKTFYDKVATYAPRQSEQQLPDENMVKMQFYIDKINLDYEKSRIYPNIERLNSVIDSVSMIDQALKEMELIPKSFERLRTEAEVAYNILRVTLPTFTKNVLRAIPEMQSNWNDLGHYSYAFFSIEQVNNLMEIVDFRTKIQRHIEVLSEISQLLGNFNFSTFSTVGVGRDLTIRKGAVEAEDAVNQYLAEITQGLSLMKNIKKLVDERLKTFSKKGTTMDTTKPHQYKGFEFEANPTPEGMGDYGDFGWAILPKSPIDSQPLFIVVIKCNHAPNPAEQRNTLLKVGYGIVQQYLDNKDYEIGGYYCYWWNEDTGAIKGNCDERTKTQITFTSNPPTND